jgi:hypothetical protein
MRFLAFLPLLLASLISAQTHQADIVIYGGTSAGVIAGIQAAKLGKKVIIVEAGQHIGGMAVEGLGGTDIDNQKEIRNSPAVGGLAREFYRRISLKYNRNGAFDAIAANGTMNTGLWRFESHVAEQVYDAWVKEARVTVLRGHRLKETGGVTMEKLKITAITCENGAVIKGKVFIDATYEGDLLAFAGLSFAVGREGNAKYRETTNGLQLDSKHKQLDKLIDPYVRPGDPSSGLIYGVQPTPAGKNGDPDDGIQGYCFRLCLTRAADRTPIEKPADFDPSHYELQRRYLAAGGKIDAPGVGVPNGKTDPGSWHSLAGNFTGFNHRYPTASYAERAEMIRVSRNHIQGLYWYLANDPSVPEATRKAWGAWGLTKDEFTDNGGWPRAFYVRNGRRLVGDFVLTEAHLRRNNPTPIVDSVGLIWWPPDFHHARCIVKDGRVWMEGAVFDNSPNPNWIPCGVPYRSLVPKVKECTNLLTPTCPSSSYVAYGAYRIEFTFMAAGQACANAASLAVDSNSPVQRINLGQLTEMLRAQGQVMSVPR